jgi:hypothetical protein
MAKAGVNYVDGAKFQKLIDEKGLGYEFQAGFVKVQAENGHRLYVAKTKRVGRVDLAFKVEGEGFHPPETKNGSIELQLDMTQPEDAILAAFSKALDVMVALPKKEAAKKAEAAKATGPKPVGWSIKSKGADGAVLSKEDLMVKMAIDKKRPLAASVLARLNADQRARYDAAFAPALAAAADKS